MHRYGYIYRVSTFIERLVSPKNDGRNARFVLQTITLIKCLEEVQRANQNVTLNVHANDGIWIFYKGAKLILILPLKDRLRVYLQKSNSREATLFSKLATSHASKGGPFIDKQTKTYRHWHLLPEGFSLLEKFVKALPSVSMRMSFTSMSHPRNFPGDLRQVALDQFEQLGRICPGVFGKTKRHKIGANERIEFDHILPYGRGGATSLLNVQVLCETCNRRKSGAAS
jgi:HNH endonuclease